MYFRYIEVQIMLTGLYNKTYTATNICRASVLNVTYTLFVYVGWPLILDHIAANVDIHHAGYTQLSQFVDENIDRFIAKYDGYFARQNERFYTETGQHKIKLDSLPRVLLIPGVHIYMCIKLLKLEQLYVKLLEMCLLRCILLLNGDICNLELYVKIAGEETYEMCLLKCILPLDSCLLRDFANIPFLLSFGMC